MLLSQAGRGEVHRVVVMRDGKPLYDQWVYVEPVGAATAPINRQGKLGLVQVWRPVASAAVPAILGQVDASLFGRLCWEIPRGLPVVDEVDADTALREGGEEMGMRLINPDILGHYRGNSTFFVNAVPLWYAEVAGDGAPPKGDPNERILSSRFFGPEEVGGMLDDGIISDGFTLAALTFLARRGLF